MTHIHNIQKKESRNDKSQGVQTGICTPPGYVPAAPVLWCEMRVMCFSLTLVGCVFPCTWAGIHHASWLWLWSTPPLLSTEELTKSLQEKSPSDSFPFARHSISLLLYAFCVIRTENETGSESSRTVGLPKPIGNGRTTHHEIMKSWTKDRTWMSVVSAKKRSLWSPTHE